MGKRLSRLYRAPAQQSEVRHAFLDLGEEERVARVLAALVDLDEATPAGIGDYTGYTYGSVIKTLGELEDRGWLSSTEVPTRARGRNPRAYELAVSKGVLQRHYQARLKEHLSKVQAVLA